MMDSLDRKLQRKRTARGKATRLKAGMDGNSTRPKPDHWQQNYLTDTDNLNTCMT